MINYNNIFDFQIWLFLQWYYMPHYVIGKQDEWKQWTNISLNGFKSFNICKQ